MLCESDAARVAAQISAEPYGPVGGMYRIEARRRQLAAVACAGGVDALWHRPRPPLAVSTHTIEAEHRSRLNLERKHILTSMKSLSSNRQSNGSYAVRTAAPPDGGGGELPRPPRSCERFVTTPLRPEMSLKQNTSQTLAGTNTKRSPTESGCSARLSGCPPAADLKRTVDYHSRTGDGLPSWHSSSVPSTPLAKAPTPIRRPSIGYFVNSKHPIDNQSKNENGTTVVWSKGIKEPAHLRFRRNVHPKRPLV
ncbi:hypothetical protein EVAR_48394_1 [Eumeta japonica]|uniref:Uncharacterized protein n=1 Tax=Eumeta variegata TaxID=151549 RepID=A0A4C1ZEM9_EUMVA|nr:hypothetical protein EVAR_48394_1 [Eumeta japonica]